MKYLDEYRNPEAAAYIGRKIKELAAYQKRSIRIMEVCGSHTMAIARYGIRSLLPENVELISGPGCPVCVTEPGYIDAAIKLAQKGIFIASFGDMLNVPGSKLSLAECRARGAYVETCYSPMRAVEIAEQNPDCEVLFLAVGFETTIAPVITTLNIAVNKKIKNFSMLTAFKLIPPAMKALLSDPEIKIDAFLCPAHVSAIIGAKAYEPFIKENKVPCVIASFEPVEIMLGLLGILQQLRDKEARIENQYARVVKYAGNPKARGIIDLYLRPVDAAWRGLGIISESGMELKPEYKKYDASKRFGIEIKKGKTDSKCRCGDVLKGKITPQECALFSRNCKPANPVGPCMVSAEGSCAAYYKYCKK